MEMSRSQRQGADATIDLDLADEAEAFRPGPTPAEVFNHVALLVAPAALVRQRRLEIAMDRTGSLVTRMVAC